MLQILYDLKNLTFQTDIVADMKASSKSVLRRLKIDDGEISCHFFQFSNTLTGELYGPIRIYLQNPSRSAKESIWSIFHSLSCAGFFRSQWAQFCCSIGIPISSCIVDCNLLRIHVAHQVLIRMLGLVATFSACPNTSVSNLMCEEISALFYVSGYVARTVRRRIEGTDLDSVHQRLALDSMCTFERIDEKEESFEESAKRWTALTNRGGLTIVTDPAFDFFQQLEMKCREYLCTTQVSMSRKIDLEMLSGDLMEMEELTYLWTEATTADVEHDIKSDTSHNLLIKIIKLSVTVRGNAFAKGMFSQTNYSCKQI